ncbi:MAG: hypothetical protein AAGA56_24100, partial [Myxococcota bacterium]
MTRLVPILCVLAAVVGCKTPPAPISAAEAEMKKNQIGRSDLVPDPEPGAAPGGRRSTVPASVVAEVPTSERMVELARNGRRGLLLSRQRGRLVVGVVNVDAPTGEAIPADSELIDLGAAPATDHPVAIRPYGRGFIATWSVGSGAGDEVWVAELGPTGERKGENRKLGTIPGTITWLDALTHPRSKTATVVWETTDAKKHHNVGLLALDRPSPTPLLKGVSAWHAAPTPSARPQVALAWVNPDGRAWTKAWTVGDRPTATAVALGEGA